jgi:hypothetical protein
MLGSLNFCRVRQIPYEPLHCHIIGNSTKTLILLVLMCTPTSLAELNKRIQKVRAFFLPVLFL